MPQLLNQTEAMKALNIKAENTFLDLVKKGMPFVQVNGKGTKKQFYFPDNFGKH